MYQLKILSVIRKPLLISALIIFSITANLFSQEKRKNNVRNHQPVSLQKINNNLSQTPQINYSQRELDLMEQINQIKQSNSETSGEKILQLQKKLEETNGSTVTKQESESFGTLIPASNFNPAQTDNLNLSYVIANAGNYVGGIAAQVEQRGATAGKIWVAVGLVNGDTGVFAIPDTIGIYYSNDNGLTYNMYAKIAFSSHNKLQFDNMDMEIIENVSGQKYLHIVFSYITNGGYGQELIGYTIVSAPTLGYAGSTLFFPGYNSNSRYTKARITSDNTRYLTNPFITIVVTQDSLAGGNHYFMSKVCRALSPYTVTPAVTYLSKCIYGVAPGHNYEVTTDVANYHNGFDSLIYVLSAYPGFEQSIYLYKAFSNSTVYPVNSGALTPSGDNLEYARVAANGGTDQKTLLITYTDNYLNSGDFDQWAIGTPDAGNWNMEVLDYTSFNNSKYGDIIGRRNAQGSFAISFKNIFGNMENVSMYGYTGFNLSSSLPALNTDYANSFASPKPLFRYLDNDSCLNIWSYYYSVSSTGGCEATNLYVRAALEGYYDDAVDQHSLYAGINVLLAAPNPPYNIIDTAYALLDYQGMANVFTFPVALSGDFYLVVKHFNCLETWSTSPVHLGPGAPVFYDFTTSDAQAFGNNMVLKGSRWCIYSGDIDQNGIIDLTDVLRVYNDGIEFAYGQNYETDLNGDYFVDLNDLVIVHNNSSNFVVKITP